MEAEDDAIEAAMKLRSGVVGEPPAASANLQAQTSSVVACQDSRETSQLADGEVEILSEHIALLDEARQCQVRLPPSIAWSTLC